MFLLKLSMAHKKNTHTSTSKKIDQEQLLGYETRFFLFLFSAFHPQINGEVLALSTSLFLGVSCFASQRRL